MNTHTPGPWFTATSGTGHYDSIWNANGEIAQCVTTSYVANEFNAKLIAAAPELLEALKGMMRHFTIMCNGRWEVMEWVDDERWTSVGPFYDTQEEAETELAILKRDIAASARATIAKATNA